MSVAVLAQGLNKHGCSAQQGQVSDRARVVHCGLRTLRTAGCQRHEKKSLSCATKALPFRRTPCSGPVGPSTVPTRTVSDLREWIPSVLAQVGPGEFGLGLCPLSSSGKVFVSLRGFRAQEDPPKVGGYLSHSAVRESSRTEGTEPWEPSGPFRLISNGQNIRITRDESLRFPADSHNDSVDWNSEDGPALGRLGAALKYQSRNIHDYN